ALPEKAERYKDIAMGLAKQDAIETPNDDVDFQTAYTRELVDSTDYPDFNSEKVAELFKSWLQDKEEDILRDRDKCYTSVVTGTKAAEHHTEWMAALDDSMECYLSDEEELKKQKAS